jgi:hypothetical protein
MLFLFYVAYENNNPSYSPDRSGILFCSPRRTGKDIADSGTKGVLKTEIFYFKKTKRKNANNSEVGKIHNYKNSDSTRWH